MRLATTSLGIALLALRVFGAEDYDRPYEEARKLSEADAAKIEQQVERKPDRPEDRAKLIAYWSLASADSSKEIAARAARTRHILWMIEHYPASPHFDPDALGVARGDNVTDHIGFGMARSWYVGGGSGRAADPDGFTRGRELWMRHLAQSPNKRIQHNAARWLESQDPVAAIEIYEKIAEPRQAGTLLGRIALEGVPGGNGDHDSVEAQAALARIESSNDPVLVATAARSYAYGAGDRYADGKIDWDFTPVSKRLVAKLHQMDPLNLDVDVLPVTLPERGKRPPTALFIGGNVQVRQLVAGSQAAPNYPPAARAQNVKGTVELNVLLGLDGKVAKMSLISGHPLLVDAAADAVRQWRYRQTFLNGQPCYVITRVDINFQ